MCYSIPAKVVEIKNHIGVIDYFGEKRNILLDDDRVKTGDYVYAQGGILVRTIPEKEALEILETWKEIFFELKKVDESLSKIKTDKLPENAMHILQKVNLRKTLTKKELASLFELDHKNELSVLYEIANNVRQRSHGNASCVHGIIEFSSYCQQNCFYCGIRKDKNIERYRMTCKEIVETAGNAVDKYGFKALVLQSGEDYWYSDSKLEEIVKSVRQLGVLVFLSIGSRSISTYKKLYAAGARAALIRFETSNKASFSKLRPGTTLQDRIALIKELKRIGYILATGFIVGLPEETSQDIINNIMLTKYLAPDMYSFGPLIPANGTPLEKEAIIKKELILKTTAIARLADSNSNILVTTALETLDLSAGKEALLAGANSMMINITPVKLKKLYSIYDNRAGINTVLHKSIKQTTDLLYNLGRAPVDTGDIRGLK
ncbi:MAG: [FeFe] hydrogenase H-cluster radical SAM maturase HydE [bacterium]|nr:[FeFe] hydrogenase H-cluster radical SAM maturase HydE [bacterium]